MKLITLKDFLKETLNEERLEQTYSLDYLNKEGKYRKYKAEQKAGTVNFQVYITDHLKQRFKERFIDGNLPINPESTTIGTTTQYKNLPSWKKLNYGDLDRVLLNGINKCIKKFKFEFGAYFIISKSTRLVIPMIVARTDKPDLRAICLNTVLHTSMAKVDVFKLGDMKYDSKKLVTEFNLYEDIFVDDDMNLSLSAAVSCVADFEPNVIFVN